MTIKTLTAVIHRESEWFVADCPEAGTVSQGHTFDEAVANLKEATELYLEETKARRNAEYLAKLEKSFREADEGRVFVTTIETLEAMTDE
ncbi:MAG: type II toxin-antitoxin system HicB family antitoxin [Synergistaceae bacterium]|jgi:predicted RNase H-like HicB family nuclease|nr:type II toxin-antitoxin system HicB family antitoxin [Synergistaceae bacterium]